VDSAATVPDDLGMVATWEDDVTALAHELGFQPELLLFLEEHGIWHEIIDGAIVVNPPPGFRHQDIAASMLAQLYMAAPPDLVVLGSHAGYFYEGTNYVMADVTVGRRSDFADDSIHVAPLLLVEILSKSTRRVDMNRKREIYEQTGVPSYWVVDPDAATLTVLQLEQGRYAEALRSPLDQPVTVTAPFPVTFTILPSTS
jgi:Uma2 family endonuclease